MSGVIQFDRPIVAILCSGEHLDKTDALFGVPSVYYPLGGNLFRGMEPNGHPTRGMQAGNFEWYPDEIVLSQDRTTLSIRTFAGTERGFDQIRVLTESNQDIVHE